MEVTPSTELSTAPARVVDLVWPWRDPPVPPDPLSGMRSKAMVQALVMVGVGLLLDLWLGHALAARILWSLAGVILLLGLFFPPAIAALHRGIARFAHGVGVLLTWLLLVPFFYFCFVPFRIWLLLTRKDPLRRHIDPARESYWELRRPPPTPESYRRQY